MPKGAENRKHDSEADLACPRCGYSSTKDDVASLIRLKKSDPESFFGIGTAGDPSLARNPLVWLTGLGFLIFLSMFVLVTLYLILAQKTDVYANQIKDSWSISQGSARDLLSESRRINDFGSLPALSGDVDRLRSSLYKRKKELEKIEAPDEFAARQSRLILAIDQVNDYLKELNRIIDKNAEKVSENDLIELKHSSGHVRAVLENAVSKFAFLPNLPSGIFRLPSKLSPLYEVHWKRLKAARARMLEEQNMTPEELQDKRDREAMIRARQVIISFMSAHLSSDSSTMKNLLSSQAAPGFDPDVKFRKDATPYDYKITGSEMTGKGNFRFYVVEFYKDFQGTQFSQKWRLVVGKDDFSIIRRKEMD